MLSERLIRNTITNTIYTEEFLDTLPSVIDELKNTDNPDPHYNQPYYRLKNVLEENTKGGRFMRSLLVPQVYYDFVNSEVTPEMRKKVMILAWCYELVRLHFTHKIHCFQLIDSKS